MIFFRLQPESDFKMESSILEGMKYRELQKMAKDLGVKANGNKKDLIKVIMGQDQRESEDEALTDVEVPLIPLEESTLNKTFDMDESEQNALNETFELESSKEPAVKEDEGSRYVEFSEKKAKHRGSPKVKPAARGGSRGGLSTPVSQDSYLSKKNKTPLRGVAKTPSSIAKKEVKAVQKVPGKASNIPRFVEFAHSKKTTTKLGKVPDFAKLHKKQMEKMESLTDTVTKQLDRAKALTNDHKDLMKRMNERKTPGKTPGAKKSEKKTPGKFAPTTLTTAKLNLNFGATNPTGAPFKFSAKPGTAPIAKVVPRPRKDLKSATMGKKTEKTPVAARRRVSEAKKGVDSVDSKQKPALVNITNSSIVGTPGKKFDLKASLAKGLSYKPHKGKLAPLMGKQTEAKGSNTPQVESKQRQMAVIKGVRLNKRAELMMKNRQIE